MKGFSASALVVVLGLAAATVPAAASQPERGGASADSMAGMMHGEMMRGMPMGTPGHALGRERPLLSIALQHRAELALSDDQAKLLEDLVGRFRKEIEQRPREIETAERELAGLLKQEPADVAQAEGKVRAIEKLRADLRLRRIQTIAEGRAVLTPEQRTKLDALAAGGVPPRRGEHRSGATVQENAGPDGGTRGMEEMHRFMSSDRMPQAMNAMMAMAERMGGGDTMLGMVRMMEMMSMMGGSGMMENPPHSQPRDEDKK